MAKFNEYPAKTTPKDADKFMLYSAEDAANKLIDYDKLADAVLNKLTSKTFGLDQGTMTLPAALNQLNSNRLRSSENITSGSDLAEDVLIKCDYGEIRLFTIQSTVTINQGSPDGKGGFLLVYQSKAGSEYGIVVLFSYAETIWMKIKSTTWGEWKKIQLS